MQDGKGIKRCAAIWHLYPKGHYTIIQHLNASGTIENINVDLSLSYSDRMYVNSYDIRAKIDNHATEVRFLTRPGMLNKNAIIQIKVPPKDDDFTLELSDALLLKKYPYFMVLARNFARKIFPAKIKRYIHILLGE